MDLLKGLWSGVNSLTDVGVTLVAFFAELTDYRLWRSLAWLLLGIILMTGGAVIWLKTS